MHRWSGGMRYQRTDTAEYCEGEFLTEQRIQSKIVTVVLGIFFVSLLGVGMGQTAVYTLGIPYIDDNVAGRESPLYFGECQYAVLRLESLCNVLEEIEYYRSDDWRAENFYYFSNFEVVRIGTFLPVV